MPPSRSRCCGSSTGGVGPLFYRGAFFIHGSGCRSGPSASVGAREITPKTLVVEGRGNRRRHAGRLHNEITHHRSARSLAVPLSPCLYVAGPAGAVDGPSNGQCSQCSRANFSPRGHRRAQELIHRASDCRRVIKATPGLEARGTGPSPLRERDKSAGASFTGSERFEPVREGRDTSNRSRNGSTSREAARKRSRRGPND